ncbi:hypothetical protein FQN54_008728 [Arachnomyces sp. PD_36]|nr:hypothetical protein FQN54_008728 [Arachnomyces sp. PD_36]
MQFSSILAVAAVAISLVSADCFGAGPTVINKELAYTNLESICTTMQGYYVSQQQRYACLTDTENRNQWYFNIKLISDGDRVLPMDECLSGLGKEILNCDLGGRTGYANWEYTSDPNYGTCMDYSSMSSNPNKRTIAVTFGDSAEDAEHTGEKKDVNITVDGEELGEPAVKSAIPFVA